MAVTEQTYARVAIEDPDGQWELYAGRLQEKPAMSFGHNAAMVELGYQLRHQLHPEAYHVRINGGRVHHHLSSYYIPDIFVVPATMAVRFQDQPRTLEVYEDPVPLVVEIWSPSTGDYDIEIKLDGYRQRGDLEIWRLHPFERTLTIWRRQADGSYTETISREGTISPVALPGVTIGLERLFV